MGAHTATGHNALPPAIPLPNVSVILSLLLLQFKPGRPASGLRISVWLDEDGKVGKLYGAKTTPHIFITAPDGKIIYQGAIDSVKSASSKDIDGATNYVAEALDAHMAGKPVPTPMTKPYGCSVKY